jgi:hypothetical protein
MSMLDFLAFDDIEEEIAPKMYIGAHPRMLILSAPSLTPEDFDALSTILPSVEELKIWFQGPIYDDEYSWIKLGVHLGRVERLTFRPIDAESDSSIILSSWIPHMKKLRALSMTWRFNSGLKVLEAFSQSRPKLETFRLDNADFDGGHTDSGINAGLNSKSMHYFQDLAVLMPSLNRLILPCECFADFTSAAGQEKLKAFERAFSKSALSLNNVYVVAGSRNRRFLVPLYGFLFATERDETILPSHLHKLVELGFDNMAFGADTLTFLLAHGNVDLAPLKVGMLLDAGCDPLRPCRISLWDWMGTITGNALHFAALFSPGPVAQVLLQKLNWTLVKSIDDIRTSCGFLPIHMSPEDADTWLAIYRELASRFSGANLLLDVSNFENWAPIHAVVAVKEHGNEISAILSVLELILDECPQSAPHSEPQRPDQLSFIESVICLFSTFYASDTFYSNRAVAVVERIVEAQFPVLALCKPDDLNIFSGDDTVYSGMMLFSCSMFAPTLFNHLVSLLPSSIRAACLHLILCNAPTPSAPRSIAKIADLGFDLTIEPMTISHPIWHYLSTHWIFQLSMGNDPIGYLADIDNLDQHTTKPFWQNFWRLVDAFGSSLPDSVDPPEMMDKFPLAEQIIPFSDPEDIIRLLDWGQGRCQMWIDGVEVGIDIICGFDRVREKSGKPNRFASLYKAAHQPRKKS